MLRKLICFVIINVGAIMLMIVIFEGLSNIAMKLYIHYERRGMVAEKLHTEYDETLGWINAPNIYIKDMYGPGIYFKTNAQRFRNNNDISLGIPPNKVRIICSGDSFTMGYGVDNDHAWCQQLASINERLEIVNMGQGGYGIDQAYLWYKRDGSKLNHDIQIFAFVIDDFARMQNDDFSGYNKPIIQLKDGELVLKNFPIQKSSAFNVWLQRNKEIIFKFNSIRLLLMLKNKISNKIYNGKLFDTQTLNVVIKIFEELQQLNKLKDSTLVLVYLPGEEDFYGHSIDILRHLLFIETSKRNIIFIDLIDDFRKQSLSLFESMFIKKDINGFIGGYGHYTETGNSYIARILYNKLLAIPEISYKLEKK